MAPNSHGLALPLDIALAPFVGLDFHTRRQFFPLSLAIDVTGTPTPATIVDALHSGRFRPEVAGVAVTTVARGLGAAPLRLAEGTRRRLRGPVRRLERRLGRAQ